MPRSQSAELRTGGKQKNLNYKIRFTGPSSDAYDMRPRARSFLRAEPSQTNASVARRVGGDTPQSPLKFPPARTQLWKASRLAITDGRSKSPNVHHHGAPKGKSWSPRKTFTGEITSCNVRPQETSNHGVPRLTASGNISGHRLGGGKKKTRGQQGGPTLPGALKKRPRCLGSDLASRQRQSQGFLNKGERTVPINSEKKKPAPTIGP